MVFKLPDVYGVFSYRTTYHKEGYTALATVSRAPIRPYRHDEYERFITQATPYYASSLSMLAGLFIFSALFVFMK